MKLNFCLVVSTRVFGSRVWRDAVPASNTPGSRIWNRLQVLSRSQSSYRPVRVERAQWANLMALLRVKNNGS